MAPGEVSDLLPPASLNFQRWTNQIVPFGGARESESKISSELPISVEDVGRRIVVHHALPTLLVLLGESMIVEKS